MSRRPPAGYSIGVVVEGTGPKPSATDTVTVNYRGHPDRTALEFDSSYKRGQPATFAVNGVIAGWTEGLQLMPVGSTYIFTIPPELALRREQPGALDSAEFDPDFPGRASVDLARFRRLRVIDPD